VKPFKIAGISVQPELRMPKQNLETLLGFVDEAARTGADVIATPEGVLDGYLTRDLDATCLVSVN
jgi:predicted amidohydrolase